MTSTTSSRPHTGAAVAGESVHGLLLAAAAATPDQPAISDAAGRWTYRQLAAHAAAAAAWLAEHGVVAGDRVVVQARSSRELAALLYGTSWLGAAFVPVNQASTPFQLGSVLASAEPAVVIAEGDAAGRLGPVSAAPVYELGRVRAEIEALQAAGAAPAGPAAVDPDAVATLIYTSGSTSAPKGVICPHRQVVFAVRMLVEVLGYRPDDVVFCRFPMSWDVGLYKVLMCAASGSEIVLAEGESDLVLLKRMRETGATVVPIVPSLASGLISLARRDRGEPLGIRLFSNTGAALPQASIDLLRQHFPAARVVRQYGQTEAKRMTVMPVEQDRQRPDSVGLPLPGTELTILDADGHPVPAGVVGEIVVSGPHVMPGYWRAPELTAATFRADPRTGTLRLHTGDYGRLDDAGYLYFEGRRDDMFKRRGIRMSTLEIEAAAMDLAGVRAAAALAPNDRHDLALFVETDLTAEAVLDELAVRLDPARLPAICRVLAEFPFTLNGKNARAELEALLARDAR